jgi:hypothetical protein
MHITPQLPNAYIRAPGPPNLTRGQVLVVGKYCINYRCSALREEKIRYTPNVTVQDHHLRPQQSAPSLTEAKAEGSE